MAAVFSPEVWLQPGLGVSVFRDVLPPALFTRLKEHVIAVEASEYEAPDDPAASTSFVSCAPSLTFRLCLFASQS